ncbi:hypothetical protein Pla52o_55500 [Novipirellula galeiformis]|uniref:Uncharacterized protein n=1 Tax=Novipirellula galeiformis TaxID=2528004 RepID=A0A5C6BRY1_9BACT|nr:hypothetical protein Pla52o_55500 [Novipirellula galeiformis]
MDGLAVSMSPSPFKPISIRAHLRSGRTSVLSTRVVSRSSCEFQAQPILHQCFGEVYTNLDWIVESHTALDLSKVLARFTTHRT